MSKIDLRLENINEFFFKLKIALPSNKFQNLKTQSNVVQLITIKKTFRLRKISPSKLTSSIVYVVSNFYLRSLVKSLQVSVVGTVNTHCHAQPLKQNSENSKLKN